MHSEDGAGFAFSTSRGDVSGRTPVNWAASHSTNLGVDRLGMTAQLSTTGNETAHVILRGDKHGPNYWADHIAATRALLADRGLPPVLVVDASHRNSQKNHLRQLDVVHDRAAQIAAGEQAIRGVMLESNPVAGRQDLDQEHPDALVYGTSLADACVDLDRTAAMLDELADAARARRARPRRA